MHLVFSENLHEYQICKGGGGLLLPSQLIVFGRRAPFYLSGKSKSYLFSAQGALKRSICGTNWVYTGRAAGVVHELASAILY